MLSYQEARQIAEAEITKNKFADDDSLIIIDELTIEKEYAWIFSYTSKRYWETNDMKYAIAGNAPIFISKSDGRIAKYRTGLSVDGMIDEHEEINKLWTLVLLDNIFGDTDKILVLRQVLDLTIDEISDLKTNKQRVLESGSKTRLIKLQTELAIRKITSEVRQRI
jgi:transcription termination factor Rho